MNPVLEHAARHFKEGYLAKYFKFASQVMAGVRLDGVTSEDREKMKVVLGEIDNLLETLVEVPDLSKAQVKVLVGKIIQKVDELKVAYGGLIDQHINW